MRAANGVVSLLEELGPRCLGFLLPRACLCEEEAEGTLARPESHHLILVSLGRSSLQRDESLAMPDR